MNPRKRDQVWVVSKALFPSLILFYLRIKHLVNLHKVAILSTNTILHEILVFYQIKTYLIFIESLLCALHDIESCVRFFKIAKAKLLTIKAGTQDITAFAFMCAHLQACAHTHTLPLSTNIWQPLSDKEIIFPSTVANSNKLDRIYDLISYLKMLYCNIVIQLFESPNSLSSSLPPSPRY